MIQVQSYVSSMCEAIQHMKLTDRQKDHARAVMRAAIEYANAQHGMYASKEARAAALSPQDHPVNNKALLALCPSTIPVQERP